MAAKSKDKKDGKEKGNRKANKLKLRKVTAKELSESELNKVQGGVWHPVVR
jgi:bacteriocin-like protein